MPGVRLLVLLAVADVGWAGAGWAGAGLVAEAAVNVAVAGCCFHQAGHCH